MVKLNKNYSRKNATNEGKIPLPRGAQRRISETLDVSYPFVCETLKKHRKGEQLRGEKEIEIIQLARAKSQEYLQKLKNIS
jgi:hypothetical protein